MTPNERFIQYAKRQVEFLRQEARAIDAKAETWAEAIDMMEQLIAEEKKLAAHGTKAPRESEFNEEEAAR